MKPKIPLLSMNSGMKTGYENVPDSLMGFSTSRPWAQKGYVDQGYPMSMTARVSQPNETTFFTDEIKGMNPLHAMERARRNWPGANVEATSFDKLKQILAVLAALEATGGAANANIGPTITNAIRQSDLPLAEPDIDPTTLLAGPARFGGGLMNMGLNAAMRYLTGK